MNIEKLQQQLIAAARAHPPSDRVPLAFERRVMARLGETAAHPEPWAVWNRVLWRATAPCLGIMLLVGAWAYLSAAPSAADAELPEELELALAAPFTQGEEGW